jgi:DNA modification methylase
MKNNVALQLDFGEEHKVTCPKKKDLSSTFANNMSLPIHRWFRYTAGFSADWVRKVFNDFPDAKTVLDPFVGSGTVLVEGDFNNKKTFGVEAHPLVYKVAKAKLNWDINPDDFLESTKQILDAARKISIGKEDLNYPPLINKCYPESTIERLTRIKKAYLKTNLKDDLKELNWFVLNSILRVSSPVGTAQWQYILPGKSKSKVLEPFTAFENKAYEMYADMKAMQRSVKEKGNSTLIKGDSRTLEGIESNSIDLVITSPPYANNYDYADATRLELSFWREINGWSDLQKSVRKNLIRACTQHVASVKNDVDNIFDSEVLNPIKNELREKFDILAVERLHHGGKKNYHLMALAYFKDLADTFVALRRVCKEDSNICFVIGDSAPYGIHLPVEKWLGELAIGAGFNSWSFEKLRDRNIKWKNRKHRHPLHEGRLWIK